MDVGVDRPVVARRSPRSPLEASGSWPRCPDRRAACRGPLCERIGKSARTRSTSYSACGPGARLIARRGDRSARHARGGRHAPSTSARSRASCAKSSASSASRSGSNLHPLENLTGERVDQHVARVGKRQTPGAQVEDRLVVQLADRRAVRALHVVSEDLELRLGVDRRVVGQEQRAVRLLGVGLLRVLPDDDLAVEHRAGRAAQDALVDLVAAAVRLRVVDRRVVVDQRCRRRRDRGRSACSRRLRRRGCAMRRCERACRRARTSATRTSRCARCARAGWRRGTPRSTPAGP